MRVVFFGTPHFASTILEYLLERGIEIVAVVSRPDKPRGRSKKMIAPPVKEVALKHSLPLFQPSKASDLEFAQKLHSLNADLFIVAAYAEILKQNILDIPRLGCINVHASLLPKFRGAAPIQWAIMQGEKQSGVTIMKMALKMDAGDILGIAKTPIPPEMTAGELTEQLADLGKKALVEVLDQLKKNTLRPLAQNSDAVTFAPKLTLQDGKIAWTKSCEQVHDHIRGVTPKPGAWGVVQVRGEKKRLLLKKSRAEPSYSGKAGEIVSQHPKELVVACQKGAVRLLEVQLEGKKTLQTSVFLQGISLSDLVFCLD